MFEYTDTKNAPAALGPYSQAVLAGNILYASGAIGIDPATGKFVGDLPVDKAKFWMTFAATFVGLSIIIMLIITFSGSANAAERANIGYDNEIVAEYYSDTVI